MNQNFAMSAKNEYVVESSMDAYLAVITAKYLAVITAKYASNDDSTLNSVPGTGRSFLKQSKNWSIP